MQKNKSKGMATKSTAEIIRDNVCTVFNLLNVIIAVALALVHAWSNLFFIFIIIVNTLIGIYQEIKAKKLVEKLSLLSMPVAHVLRDGRELEVHPDSVEKGDVLLLESDERYAAHSFKYFHPTEFVITNLYRDQLTRNGHPESVFDAILPAIHPDTELILNGDDPLSSCFAIGHEKVKWFGLNRCATDTETSTGVYHDGAYCPVCHAPMEYEYVHYNHIGAYRCTSCGHARPDPDYAATELDLKGGKLVLDGQYTVALAFRSIYNVYNILAAYAACRECGVEGAAIADTLSSYILKNGRMQTFTLGQHHGILLTSKHENSIAYDTNLRYIASTNEDCTVLIIVDAVSRKYFTSETSWLWDIDFDQLNVPHVKRVILSGMYRNDLAERFRFTGVQNWEVIPGIPDAAAAIRDSGSEALYVVTCFSDRDKLLNLPDVKKEG